MHNNHWNHAEENGSAEPGSIVLAMLMQYDADLLQNQISFSTSLRVKLATRSLSSAHNYCLDRPVSLVIFDAHFPRQSAFDICKELREADKAKQILFIDTHYNPLRAKRAEAVKAAYCTKSEGLKKVLESVEVLANDSQIVPDRVNGLVDEGLRFRIDCPVFAALTPRELEVLTILAEGCSVQQCAEKLSLSTHTVDNHKTRMMKKLGIHKMAGLIRIAIRNGLVEV